MRLPGYFGILEETPNPDWGWEQWSRRAREGSLHHSQRERRIFQNGEACLNSSAPHTETILASPAPPNEVLHRSEARVTSPHGCYWCESDCHQVGHAWPTSAGPSASIAFTIPALTHVKVRTPGLRRGTADGLRPSLGLRPEVRAYTERRRQKQLAIFVLHDGHTGGVCSGQWAHRQHFSVCMPSDQRPHKMV